TLLGTGTLDANGNATLSLSTLALGGHNITAVYVGAGNYSPSMSAPLAEQVNQATTSTTLSSSVNPAFVGQSVIFTAMVSSANGTPTGVVTFMDGNTVIGTGNVDATGKATLTISSLALGSHSITAVYGGDAKFAGSTSAALAEQVQLATTSTTLTS